MSNAYAIFDIASEYATSSIVGAQLVSALLPEAAPKISLDNKVQAWHNTACKHGGVGAPVGLTVFKTAGGSLGAAPGGFDSHTPLPTKISSPCCEVYCNRGININSDLSVEKVRERI